MALKQVTPGSFNYGSYARPQQVKVRDTSGVARGVMSAVQSVAEGFQQKKAENKAEAEKQKQIDLIAGQTEALRTKALENKAASEDVLKFMTEYQTDLQMKYDAGELDEKEYARLKTIENANYEDTVKVINVLDGLSPIEIDESQLKDSSKEKARIRNAVANGQYKISSYDGEKGGTIEIEYTDADNNQQKKTLSAAAALEYFSSDESIPKLKFNFIEGIGADTMNRFAKLYQSRNTGVFDPENAAQVSKAAGEMLGHPEIQFIAKKQGAGIWEDALDNPEGSYDPSNPDHVNAVAQKIAETSISSYAKKVAPEIKEAKPPKLEQKVSQFLTTLNAMANKGNNNAFTEAAKQIYPGLIKQGNTYIVPDKDVDGNPTSITFSETELIKNMADFLDSEAAFNAFQANVKVPQGKEPKEEKEDDFVPPHLRK